MNARPVWIVLGIGLVVAAGCRGILGAEQGTLEGPPQDGGAGQSGSAGASGAAGTAGSAAEGGNSGAAGAADAGDSGSLMAPLTCSELVGTKQEVALLTGMDSSKGELAIVGAVRQMQDNNVLFGVNRTLDGTREVVLVGGKPTATLAHAALPNPGELVGILKHRPGQAALLIRTNLDAGEGVLNLVEVNDTATTSEWQGLGPGKLFMTDTIAYSTIITFTGSGATGEIVATMVGNTQISAAIWDGNLASLPVTPIVLSGVPSAAGYQRAIGAKIGDLCLVALQTSSSVQLIQSSCADLSTAKPVDIALTFLDLLPYSDGTLGVLGFLLPNDALPTGYFGTLKNADVTSFNWQSLAVPFGGFGADFFNQLGDRHVLLNGTRWVTVGPGPSDPQNIHYTWVEPTSTLRAQGVVEGIDLTNATINSSAVSPRPVTTLLAGADFDYAWVRHPVSGTVDSLHVMTLSCHVASDAGL